MHLTPATPRCWGACASCTTSSCADRSQVDRPKAECPPFHPLFGLFVHKGTGAEKMKHLSLIVVLSVGFVIQRSSVEAQPMGPPAPEPVFPTSPPSLEPSLPLPDSPPIQEERSPMQAQEYKSIEGELQQIKEICLCTLHRKPPSVV